MRSKVVITLIFWVGFVSGISAEQVTFKGTRINGSGDPFMLTGKLTKPQGEGPFPALVCLHGCGGISRRDDHWVKRLSNWGYVALQVDSFGPRGRSNICTDTRLIPPEVRAQDAHDAKAFLTGFPFVDRENIAAMGWSHGGWTAIYAVSPKITIQNKIGPFKGAIAFYPYCDLPLSKLEAPLLILIGDDDDWTPARMCSQMMAFRNVSDKIILKIYPKAHHGFDSEGMDRWVQGARGRHRLLYHPEAAADAAIRVKEFLKEHLK